VDREGTSNGGERILLPLALALQERVKKEDNTRTYNCNLKKIRKVK
jgi:hypothetical protein